MILICILTHSISRLSDSFPPILSSQSLNLIPEHLLLDLDAADAQVCVHILPLPQSHDGCLRC